ncbi:hypothetical protein AB4915_04775 [Bifidobacterium dentium]|uniref:DNA gyrase n=1 Tax=Bifidobacterium dentium TaxID=1689 RepID=UPI0018C34736|nr:DNA gyrase [Bifidobacterium dentium]MBF9708265.1 DNA gyrase [Bifidobacterium dentium]
MPTEKKNTYITLHKNFVRTDIEYTDARTGEQKTFNSVTLPKGTVIDGVDVSYYQFSPLFANPSKYRGENYVDVPLLTEREVWLQKSILDAEGNPVVDEATGCTAKDTVKVMPTQIKEALDLARKEYLGNREQQPLDSRAQHARGASVAMADHDIPFDAQSR